MKSLRISVVIVITFIVWWTPYYTMMVIFMFLNPDKHVSEELQSGIFFFGMSNSLVNPLIYGAFHLWRPRSERLNGSVYQFRDSSMQHQRSVMSNSIRLQCSTLEPMVHRTPHRGPTQHRGIREEEETSLVSLEQIKCSMEDSVALKLMQRYRGALGGCSPTQTHI